MTPRRRALWGVCASVLFLAAIALFRCLHPLKKPPEFAPEPPIPDVDRPGVSVPAEEKPQAVTVLGEPVVTDPNQVDLFAELEGSDDPAYRRYLLQRLLENVTSLEDLESTGFPQVLATWGKTRAFEALRAIADSGQGWAREYLVGLLDTPNVDGKPPACREAAATVLVLLDESWAYEALHAMVLRRVEAGEDPECVSRSAEVGRLLWDMGYAGTASAKKLFAEFAGPKKLPLSGSDTASFREVRELCTISDDAEYARMLDHALYDLSPFEVKNLVRSAMRLPDGVNATRMPSSLLQDMARSADTETELAMMDVLREQVENYGSNGANWATNITAMSALLDEGLNSDDLEVRQAAEGVQALIAGATDAEDLQRSIAEDISWLRELIPRVAE